MIYISVLQYQVASRMWSVLKPGSWLLYQMYFLTVPLSTYPGVFIKRCVLEYQTLTFSQTVRLHKQWQNFVQDDKNWAVPLGRKTVKPPQDFSPLKQQDFTAALKAIALSNCDEDRVVLDEDKVVLDDMKLGTEALQLAAIHGRFGHQ